MAVLGRCQPQCKPRPRLNQRGTLQRPKPRDVATVNTHHERDLTDDANWQTVAEIWFALRYRRASEIVAVDQVEGVRFVQIETWGTATTRQAKSSWRMTYSDRDGAAHVLEFTAVLPSDDGRWVVIEAEEQV